MGEEMLTVMHFVWNDEILQRGYGIKEEYFLDGRHDGMFIENIYRKEEKWW